MSLLAREWKMRRASTVDKCNDMIVEMLDDDWEPVSKGMTVSEGVIYMLFWRTTPVSDEEKF